MTKASVSRLALERRVNRNLAKIGRKLVKPQVGSSAYNNCGAYYLLDTERNTVIDTKLDLAAFAKTIMVLGQHERLESEAEEDRQFAREHLAKHGELNISAAVKEHKAKCGGRRPVAI